MKTDFVFVSESVTKGHPDKLCDQISDAIVDRFLAADSTARIGAECAVSTGIVFVAAHFSSRGNVDVTDVARAVIRAAGYERGPFNADDCAILTSLSEVARPAPAGPTGGGELVASPAEQQATVFGYACTDTQSLMPLPIVLAHELARSLDEARESGRIAGLSPDSKTQVAVEYRARKPVRVHGVSVVASPAVRDAPGVALRDEIIELVIKPLFAGRPVPLDAETRVFVNGEPGFGAGGPGVHSGLTGRKTAVDTYGEYARHGGSALSGKDALRIDRMGAYAARYAAKNVVAAGLASECEIQLSYSIGEASPVSLSVDSFGTGAVSDEELTRRVAAVFDFRPGAILRDFAVLERFRRGDERFFLPTAVYGHMGREDLAAPWEVTDRCAALRAASS